MNGAVQIDSRDVEPGGLSVAVALVLMTVAQGRLAVLLHQRESVWALPGARVRADEAIEAAAQRVLAARVGLADAYVEQLYTFGDAAPGEGQRVVTVAYFALFSVEALAGVLAARPDLLLAQLDVPWDGETGGPVRALAGDGSDLPLAFDHAAILGHAVMRLRGKLDYSRVAFALLPPDFALRELQEIHEAIRGTKLNKPAFRRRMLDKGLIEGTGERERGTAYRPAELYRLKAG